MTDAAEGTGDVLTREELFQQDNTDSEVYEGLEIQPLSGIGYRQIQGDMIDAATTAASGQVQQDYQEAELLGYLARGVVNPKLTRDEWKHVAKQPGSAMMLEAVVDRIKAISGVKGEIEEAVERAGNALKETGEDTASD